VESYYSNKGAEEDLRFLVNFDGDVVALDIPKDGIILPSGWSIQPMVYPTKVSLLCIKFSFLSALFSFFSYFVRVWTAINLARPSLPAMFNLPGQKWKNILRSFHI